MFSVVLYTLLWGRWRHMYIFSVL